MEKNYTIDDNYKEYMNEIQLNNMLTSSEAQYISHILQNRLIALNDYSRQMELRIGQIEKETLYRMLSKPKPDEVNNLEFLIQDNKNDIDKLVKIQEKIKNQYGIS